MRLLDYIVLGSNIIGLVLFIALLISIIGYLIGHATRKNISYINFNQKIKYFKAELPNAIFFIFTGFIIVSGIFMFYLLVSGAKEYYYYGISNGILLLLGIMLYQVFKLLQPFNEDLMTYRQNYSKVQKSFISRDKAKISIDKTKVYRKDIKDLIFSFEEQIKEVDDPIKYNLRSSLDIIDDFVVKQSDSIKTYTDEVVSSFNSGLESYFKNNETIVLKAPSISLDFENQYNNVRKDIYDSFRTIFNDTLYKLIDTGKYNTGQRITKGLQTLKNNQYKPTQELIELILERISSIKGSAQELVDYLLEKEIIELDELIGYAINKEFVWVFKLDLFDTNEKLITISQRLIKEDAHFLALAFITKYFGSLKKVLTFTEKIVDVNSTWLLFTNYIQVMTYDSHYYTEHKEFENKVVSIQEFYSKKKPSVKLQNDIYKAGNIVNAYNNSELVNKLYNYTQNKYDDLRVLSIKAILLYINQYKDGGLFDIDNLSKKINDLYERLLFDELGLLTVLLLSLFIHKNDDEQLYDETMEDIKNNEVLFKYVTKSLLTQDSSKHKQIAKDIIKRLVNKEQLELSNIILTIEKERCTLDDLTSL